VVLKIARSTGPDDIETLHREYEILDRLEGIGVVRALALDTVDGRTALVLEDVGLRTLGDLVRQDGAFGVLRFLELASSLARIVEHIHARNVVHNDINPGKIVVDATLHPTLVGFDIATSVAGRTQRVVVPEELESTLPYMAPEQTGRTNRVIDHRADFYSLGATC
jgi:serine/threonine protein kinase